MASAFEIAGKYRYYFRSRYVLVLFKVRELELLGTCYLEK
jgi:hypothetical protein